MKTGSGCGDRRKFADQDNKNVSVKASTKRPETTYHIADMIESGDVAIIWERPAGWFHPASLRNCPQSGWHA